MKKTISILGCGWLGIPLAEFLIKEGYAVNGSTRTEKKLPLLQSKNIHPFLIDLENLNNSIIEFLNTDVLLIATTCKNSKAFKVLIKHIENSSVQQIIFISSTSVYPLLNKVVTENDQTIDSPLATIEQLFTDSEASITTILRLSGLIGPKRNPARFFRNGKTVKHPEGFVNLIHLADCIHIISGIIKTNAKNKIFNVCSDEHPKRIDFYTELAQRNSREIPEFQNPDTIEYKIVSNVKIKQFLNYEFIYPHPLYIPDEAYD